MHIWKGLALESYLRLPLQITTNLNWCVYSLYQTSKPLDFLHVFMWTIRGIPASFYQSRIPSSPQEHRSIHILHISVHLEIKCLTQPTAANAYDSKEGWVGVKYFHLLEMCFICVGRTWPMKVQTKSASSVFRNSQRHHYMIYKSLSWDSTISQWHSERGTCMYIIYHARGIT